MGVAMLPRFAAIVCRTITGIMSSGSPAILRIRMENGTNVIRDTSFVISMLEKKQSAVRVKASWRVECIPASRDDPR